MGMEQRWAAPAGALLVALDERGAAALGVDREELVRVAAAVPRFGVRADDVELWSLRELRQAMGRPSQN